VDSRLVTGQNPASAKLVGEGVLAELQKIKEPAAAY
jgi:putative intracellular protease/amidase